MFRVDNKFYKLYDDSDHNKLLHPVEKNIFNITAKD